MTTISKIDELILQNKEFAPVKANVILMHEDGRVFYAEKFEMGSKFWHADTMQQSIIQGIYYKLKIIANRSGDQWVSVTGNAYPASALDAQNKEVVRGKSAATKRADRVRAAQESMVAAINKMKVDVIPPVKEATQKAKEPTVAVVHHKPAPEFVKVEAKAVPAPTPVDALSRFTSIRTLEGFHRHHKTVTYISIRNNGKILLSKGLRDAIQDWKGLDILVTPDMTEFAIIEREGAYRNNLSGSYAHKTLAAGIKFPDGKSTIRVSLEWDAVARAYIGKVE